MATFGKEDDDFASPARNYRRDRGMGSGSSCNFDLFNSPATGRVAAKIPPSPFMQKLGYGTGVAVYLFQRGSTIDGSGLSPWAVKKTRARTQKDNSDKNVEKMLAKEAFILKQLKHANIVGFRAFSRTADGSMCLSMENGEQSLMDLIETRDEEGLGPFPASQIYHVALGLARALKYLHNEKHLLHGDLKSANVLISGDFQSVKLCDFGVTLRLKQDLTGLEDTGDHYIGTEPWSAPEIIHEEGPVTDKADIFSYGLVLWEMMSLTLPHVDLLDDSSCTEDESLDQSSGEARYHVALGTRPPPSAFPLGPQYDSLLGLFWACTEELPASRPSASFIVDALESIPVPSDMNSREDKENVPMDVKK